MLPKYEIIKREIVKKIDEGIFKAGEKIYSESELKEKYSVSNTTVVKALNDLVNEGILIRRQGKGTYVRRHLLHKKVLFSELTPKDKVSQIVAEKTVTKISSPYIDRDMSMKLGGRTGKEKIIHIRQIAYVNEVIWKVQDRYIFSNKLSADIIKRLNRGASLSKELNITEHTVNFPIKMKIRYVTLDRSSEIFKIMVEGNSELEKREDISLIFLEKITYNSDEEPIVYMQSCIHPNYYEIEIASEY